MRTAAGVAVRGSGIASDRWTSPVKDKDLTAPPGSPTSGDRYIVASGGSGAWSSQDTNIAEWVGGVWQFTVPVIGLTAYVEDETEYYSWNGSAWVQESFGPHAVTHKSGGADEVATVTPASGAIPKADGTGKLPVGFIPVIPPLTAGAMPLSGFVNRTDSVIAMNGADFEIAPAVTTFDVWVNGVKFIKSALAAVTISNDKTLHYIYYDAAGVLTVGTSLWILVADIGLVATVFKDGSNYVVTDERHGWRRNRDWHAWAHDTIGARYESGLTGTFLDATFSITQGNIMDEDIEFNTGGAETTCQLWYRDVGLAAMRVELGVTTSYKVAAGVIQYDNAGTLTNVSNNRYVNNYVYATNVPAYPIVVVVGQAEHVLITAARAEALPSILLEIAEWKLLYRTTYQNVGGTPTHVEDTDFRLQSTGPAQAAAATTHDALLGVTSDQHHTQLHAASHVPGGTDALATVYIDRGDPAAVDFAISSGLTADGAWNTLDLSSIAPATAASRLVHLRCRINDNSVETLMQIRKLGNTNAINATKAVTVVSGDSVYFDAWVMLDSLRKIEYNIESGMGTAEITVAGWVA